MCPQTYELTPLMIDGVTAVDLEQLLAMLGIDCLADTIARYWNASERLDVFHWASASIAARRCPGALLLPEVPAVLQPFIAASAAA